MSRPFRSMDVFKAIADPTRRAMLNRLGSEEMTVSEIARPFRMSMPAISQHLRVLREVRLVRTRRVGRQRWYRADLRPLRAISKWIDKQLET